MMRYPAELVAPLRRSYEGRKVCVTGGAGFIGGHLVDGLLALGASVTVIDDLSNSTLAHLAELIEIEPDRLRFVQASILEDAALAEAVGGCSAVFHLAALGSVPRSVDEPERTWIVNATGTLRVLEAARGAGARRIVFAASSSAYGETERLPKVETIPPAPRSPYAASKVAGEMLMEAWAHTYQLETLSLRYFNVFGPRQPAGSAYAAAVPRFCAAIAAGQRPVIYGDGGQTRDFTYVSNAVLATMQAGAVESPPPGAVLNVGAGRRISVADLARNIAQSFGRADLVPRHEPARAGDVRHSLADISRAREVLGYRPIATAEEGLAETVEWTRQIDAARQREE
ncbi:MAG TPA: GDP-mannose 4,6-dehydratase [Phycisphaerales bacterium]|nr:GDP-mannose 4,6-dehydratase [Phycisphaerales bacterium]